MQLLVQVYLADYIKAYFGLGLGLVTSGLSLGLGLFCLGLRLLASASNFPFSLILFCHENIFFITESMVTEIKVTVITFCHCGP